MEKKMRVMTEVPLNAETDPRFLRSWITANSVFFNRNQGEMMKEPIPLEEWELLVTGEVEEESRFNMDLILGMPKATVANTLECSGNSRSLLKEKARGNPWTIGGVGNSVYGGVWLRDLLTEAGLGKSAKHVSFEGLENPAGRAGIKFIRSIPMEKAMDNVYRVFQKGEDSKSGEVVTRLKLKSIITQPLQGEEISSGPVVILGAAYGGEAEIDRVEVSTDNGKSWHLTELIGPIAPYAWRQWQYVWNAGEKGTFTVMSRAFDLEGREQPMNAVWNVLGYGNNGVTEHAVMFHIH